MPNEKDLYRGGMNAGVWAAVFSGKPSDPSHANPAILNNKEWRSGYIKGNADYFDNKGKDDANITNS